MQLFMCSIFLCCLAGSYSSPGRPSLFMFGTHHWTGARDADPSKAETTTAKPRVDPRNPTNAEVEVFWIQSEDYIYDTKCVKGKVVYAIEMNRNCRSYIKCESGNIPVRILCPYRQMFSKDTLNCEEDALCAGFTLEEREQLNFPKPYPRTISLKESILDKNQQKFTDYISEFENETPEEMLINVFENFLKSLLCVMDIKNDYQTCPKDFRSAPII